jgi:hypothetical protein
MSTCALIKCVKTKIAKKIFKNKVKTSQIGNGLKKKVQLGDCFEEEEEFLYGFRTKVTLFEDQPCILGSTCKGFLKDYYLESYPKQKRRNKYDSKHSDSYNHEVDSESQLNRIKRFKLSESQNHQYSRDRCSRWVHWSRWDFRNYRDRHY